MAKKRQVYIGRDAGEREAFGLGRFRVGEKYKELQVLRKTSQDSLGPDTRKK